MRSTTARTAPASRESAPAALEAYASQSIFRERRRPDARNSVPTGSPASAAATSVAEASTVVTPAWVAILAASSLVVMPPVPTPDPTREVSTARSSTSATSVILRAPGRPGWSV